MSEIKVGEYARTVDGIIGKIIPYDNGIKMKISEDDYWKPCTDSITKHSKNILDLIEVGDYVNGLEVYRGKVASGKEKLLVRSYMINGMALEVVNIKTIVTKEQMTNIEYKVESEDK